MSGVAQMPARSNLASFLDDLASDPERAAFALRTAYRGFRWTAGRTRAAAFGFSARLAAEGVRPGDRVVLEGPNSPEWCAAFLGIVARGAVAVPLDAGCSPEFFLSVVRRIDARAAIVTAERLEIAARASLAAVPLEEPSPAAFDGGEQEPHRARPSDTAEIVFTSGTTAEPRGVELSHANLLSTLARIENAFRKREWYLKPFLPMRLLCVVPLSHLFGQSLGLFVPIVMKSTAVFIASPQPARLLRTVREERPLALIAVPRTIAGLRDAVQRELDRRGTRARFERRRQGAADRRAWRRILATRDVRSVLGFRTWVIVVGGAELDPDLEDFWSGCGMAVVQGYGMTEAAPIIAIHNPLGGGRHSLGKPLAGVEVKLAPDGELWVRGPNVMKGYLGDPVATSEAVRDGWLRTGDLGARDEHGRLYFRGRKKDVIVTSSGMNVFPADVEAALRSLPEVVEAVAFGAPGAEGDEVHAAVIAVASRPSVDPERIRTRVNERLASHQHVRRVVLWAGSDFPRTATGKVRRGEVAKGASSPGTSTAARSRLLSAFERVRRGGEAGAAGPVSERLDLDSLETLELLSLVEEEFGVAIDDREVAAAPTVEQLQRIVAGEGAPGLRLAMPRWGRRAPATWVREAAWWFLLPALFRAFVRLGVEGRHNVASLSGAHILAANHTSVLDVPAILMALPRGARRRLCPAMAIETLPERFEHGPPARWRRLRSSALYGLAVLLFQAYPLPQSRGFRPSLEYTGELLDHGLLPLVFPEGRMSRTGRIEEFKSGVGLLAVETRARVVPVRVEGLGRLMPPTARWPRRGRARVVIGEPIDLPSPGTGAHAAAARMIERAVRGLAPEPE
jgi:long-chain acyl-CoA synthetase